MVNFPCEMGQIINRYDFLEQCSNIWAMFEPTPTWPNVDFRQLFMWIEQSHISPFGLNITFGWLQKLNPGYEICIISYQVNLASEVSAMFNNLMPSLNSRSLPFVIFLVGFPIRCQNLSSGAIRPGGLLFRKTILSHFMFSSRFMLFPTFLDSPGNINFSIFIIFGKLTYYLTIQINYHFK